MPETYSLEVTGSQAHLLARWLSLVAQDVDETDSHHDDVVELAAVGEQAAEIAEQADEWPG